MSLDKAEMALEIEGRLGVTFQEKDQETIKTIGDIHQHIIKRMELSLFEEEVLAAIFEIVSKYTDVPASELTVEMSLGYDHGID